MESPLKNCVAVVSGAAGGIGLETSIGLAKRGATLCMLDLDLRALENAKASSSALQDAVCHQVDVSKAEEVESCVQSIFRAHSRIDILVNNAGILRDASLLKMTETQFNQVIDVNLKGVFLLGQACAKAMVQKKSGSIINISSVAYRGIYGQSNYSAAKAGVIGMTKTWALELSRHGINVNAIAPGLIETSMTQTIPPQVKTQMIKNIPLGRMGQAKEVADLVAFLASDKSSYIQGEVISINGGFLI
ncbi:MAG: 3-oxoacyl-ACP reductase FabG [Bdellovibrionales bacterium]|nr:3-oxoacyl-ACP reductase FabG [Bdellovibrionales bacterium]